MTSEEWDTIAALLAKGFKWRDPFGEASEAAYRVLLDGYDAEHISTALRVLVARGQVFGPTPGELVAAIRHDPSTPTFDEALTLVRSALRAYNRPLTGEYATEAQMLGARERNVLERAESLGVPLVAAFVARHGVDRLLDEVGELDGQYGAIRRKELEAAWDRHCEALEGRQVAALVTGRRGGIGHLDPLAALSGVRPVAGELEAGER